MMFFRNLTVTLLLLIAIVSCKSGFTEQDRKDWLLDGSSYVATITENKDQNRIVLGNGLVERIFSISPNCATVAYNNLMTGESEIRAVRPEAELTINGKTYIVGGLTHQPVQNFLSEEFRNTMRSIPGSFTYVNHKISDTKERMAWQPNEQWLTENLPWPVPGKRITFTYKAPEGVDSDIANLKVDVVYEMYNGAPIISKWLEIRNDGEKQVVLNAFKSEILAMVETAPKVHYGEPHEVRVLCQEEGATTQNYRKAPAQTDAPRDYIDRFTQLFVVTDYAMGGDMEPMKDNPAVRWCFDHPEYEKTGIRYYGQYKPARLEVMPPMQPEIKIPANSTWDSFTAFEMMRDATDTERRGLAECKFWRMMAPWTQENPILMHVKKADPESVKKAIDQCAEVGFEMVIMTFGSGFNILNSSEEYLGQMKELGQYAKSKGIALGGYSLLASCGGKKEYLAISPITGKPATSRFDGARFGHSPCLATDWGETYFNTLKAYFKQTGMNVFEHDGSYPGDVCASTSHSGHEGVGDSQYKQWERIHEYYQWCRANGIYLMVPDWHFLSGSSKTPMGYVETNWSLPRAYQEIIERQNIYDGTWQKSPSMGYMFVPLTQYHGGGAAATIEPLNEHLDHYECRLQNLFGAGVQACYRGPRLYDTDTTKKLVKKWVSFYKKYRVILNSDIIHLRRPDGKNWDGILHVNPTLEQKGFISVYNPLDVDIEEIINVPLYYSGLTNKAVVKEQDGKGVTYKLNRDYSIDITITIPAKGYNWYVIQ